MTRLREFRLRALLGTAATAALLGLPAAALAQTPAPQPHIDSAPEQTGYGTTAVIKGHLDNGKPGDEVTLQRRRDGSAWKAVATKQVDGSLKVSFRRRDMRRSSTYRLAFDDDTGAVHERSNKKLVRVTPKLKFHVRPRDAFTGNRVRLRGRLLPTVGGRHVVLQQRVHGEWRHVDRVAVDKNDGSFAASFKAHKKGHRRVRALFRGDSLNPRAANKKRLTIYRPEDATWYGPGLYGNKTACGKTLGRNTLGVAHRTLPCGAKVSILYHGRTITVPVIDRGPYSHADWDLTRETADRLHFSGSDEIGVTR